MNAALAVLLQTYDEARLLWEAKGWTMEDVADELTSDKALKDELQDQKLDLSQASLSRKSTKGEPLPRPVAEAIQRLATRPTREHLTGIVELGLKATRGQSTNQDPRAVAQALLAHFPTDAFARQLADALVNGASTASGTGSLFDVCARAIADRLPRLPKAPKFARLLAQHLTQQLDRLSAGRLALSGAVGGLAGGAVACGVLLLGAVALLAFILSGRSPAWFGQGPEVVRAPAVVPSPQAANISQPVIVIANATQAGTHLVFDMQALLGAVSDQQMGSKVVDMAMPGKPLPNQKLPPCLAEAYEKELNGGCWTRIYDAKPPCGRYLFHGAEEGCYRPIAADPQKPVGLLPEAPVERR